MSNLRLVEVPKKKVQVSKLRGKPRHESRSTEGVTEWRDIPANKGSI
jgi:hypothetical protein